MKNITYRFEVKLTSPLTDDPQHPDFYTEAQATSSAHRYAMEKALFKLIKGFSGDCDVEMLDFSVDDDGLHGGECECDQCQMERAADTAQEPSRG